MQAISIVTPGSQRVQTLRARTLPTPVVSKTVVERPINLKPKGNTVSLSVPAEMPFMSRGFTVYTQASGGMAKPDASQRSQRLYSAFPLNGLGAEVTDEELTAWYRAYDADGKAGKAITPEKEAYWRGVISADKDKKAAAAKAQSAANWSKVGDIFTTTVNAASNVTSSAMQARIAEANAKAAASQAEIERARSGAFMSRLTDVSQYGAGMAARKSITIPLLLVAGGALAIATFLYLRKKRSAAAPAAA